MRQKTLAATLASLLTIVLAACAAAPQVGSFGLAGREEPMTEAERREFIRKMDARRLETPFLRITEKCAVEHGKVYVVTGIMAKDKLRFDVRDEAGGLIFAEAAHTGRMQEYAPVAEVSAETVKHVLLEYDVAEIGSQWPRLISGELACQVGGQSVSWVAPDHVDDATDTILASKQTPIERLSGHDCRHFHRDAVAEGAPCLTWDYWIDNETYDTVRFVRSGGRTYDYTIEHLKADQGLRWELDAGQFKDEPPAKLVETPFK